MQTLGTLQGIAIREASRAPMKEQQQVEVAMRHGIVQDYYGTGQRHVTMLDLGQWQEVLAELGIELPWHTRRANLLITGIDLAATIGRRLQIGACRFGIGGETTPCYRMDELPPGLGPARSPPIPPPLWRPPPPARPPHLAPQTPLPP